MASKCPKCQSSNVVGPFEMDGYADGEYQAKGLFWIVCRECGRTTRVDAPLPLDYTRSSVARLRHHTAAQFDCHGCGRTHGEPGCD